MLTLSSSGRCEDMKKAIERIVDILKGVSTLDMAAKKSRAILLLLASIMALGGAARGGHSTPNFNGQLRGNLVQIRENGSV